MELKDFYNKFKDKAIIIQAHPHRNKHSKLADINYLHGVETVSYTHLDVYKRQH